MSPPIAARSSVAGHTLYAATSFLSAFLLFQVQLLMGKRLLPWFGGTPALWTTCMLFYQLLLLAGYAYAHVLTRRLGAASQRRIHLGLLLLSLLLLMALALVWRSPILPSAAWRPGTPDHPVRDVLAVLIVSVGLPFFLLSSTSPLLQRWHASAYPQQSPYRLYAVSNLGSLLGLLTYPSLFEPFIGLRAQAWLWALAYIAFAAGSAVCSPEGAGEAAASGGAPEKIPAATPTEPVAQPRWVHYALWFALPAAASMLLLATTNHICQEVAVIPLLWVLPLSLYLLSFILCFAHDRWYRRELFQPALAIVTVIAFLALYRGPLLRVGQEIWVFSLALFIACMICHGETSRLRPATGHLTAFYLMIAAGGAAGGAFVTLLAPRVFSGFWELHLALWLVWLFLSLALVADRGSWIYQPQAWLASLLLFGFLLIPEVMRWMDWLSFQGRSRLWYYLLLALSAATTFYWAVFYTRRTAPGARFRWVQACLALAVVLLGWGMLRLPQLTAGVLVTRSRSFYGVLSIWELFPDDPQQHAYLLVHGRTRHGSQLRDPRYQQTATSYYGVRSGAGLALLYHPRHFVPLQPPLRVGAVGLGTGTVAVYARPGDFVRFYEINPDIIRLCTGQHPYFSYLQGSKGQVDIVAGDARTSLEREAELGDLQQFDVLVLDAFNSDAIPVHLLTREAFALYLRHLRGRDSILAVHITNRVLDLEPVVASLASDFGLAGLVIDNPDRGNAVLEAHWVLLARDPAALNQPEILEAARPLEARGTPLWTDDYSNLLRLLKP